MARINVYNDRAIRKLAGTSFSSMRVAPGSALQSEETGRVYYVKVAGQAIWDNTMTSIEFKTDHITAPLSSLQLHINIESVTSTSGMYVCRSFREDDNNNVVTEDYRSWLKAEQGGDVDLSNIVKYSDHITTSGMQTFELNNNAMTDIVNRDYFQIALVTHAEVDGVENPGGSDNGDNFWVIWQTNDEDPEITRPYLTYATSTSAKLKITSTKLNLSNSKIKIS